MPDNTDKPVVRTIRPAQLKWQVQGQVYREAVVSLTEPQSIAGVREVQEVWRHIQGDRNSALRRGDRLSLIGPDGLHIADGCVVIRHDAGSVWHRNCFWG